MSRVGGVGYYLPCPRQGPGGLQVLEGRQIAANHLLSRFLQLPQEVLPLLCFFGEGPDVQLPLEVLGDDRAQEEEGLRSSGGPQPSPLSLSLFSSKLL